MFGEYTLIHKLLICIAVGYLLGSIPFAQLAARLKGVDIFSTGIKTAGTANVFWNVGRRTGALVFIGDVAKGSAAVLIAQWLQVPGLLVLVGGGAAVVGHWNSVFSGFRGGDGMATLMGVTFTLTPIVTVFGVVGGLFTLLLLRRSPLRSSWAIASCFAIMVGLGHYYQADRGLMLGLATLATLVIIHSLFSFRRRGRLSIPEQVALDLQMDSESDLQPAAPENP